MIDQVTAVLENRPGRLSEILKTLADEKVDINGITIADSVDYGLCRMIVSDPEKASAALKAAGFVIKMSTVLAIEIPDVPGALHKSFTILAENAINIQYVYAFGTKLSQKAMIIIKTDDDDKTVSLLKTIGVASLDRAQLEERLTV